MKLSDSLCLTRRQPPPPNLDNDSPLLDKETILGLDLAPLARFLYRDSFLQPWMVGELSAELQRLILSLLYSTTGIWSIEAFFDELGSRSLYFLLAL